jgi:hypothetical protein
VPDGKLIAIFIRSIPSYVNIIFIGGETVVAKNFHAPSIDDEYFNSQVQTLDILQNGLSKAMKGFVYAVPIWSKCIWEEITWTIVYADYIAWPTFIS